MHQMSLFDDPVSVMRPPAVPVRTSIQAADDIAERTPVLRGRVYGAIAKAGAQGLTRKELEQSLGLRIQTICPRVWELLKQKLIYQTDEARDKSKVLRASRA